MLHGFKIEDIATTTEKGLVPPTGGSINAFSMLLVSQDGSTYEVKRGLTGIGNLTPFLPFFVSINLETTLVDYVPSVPIIYNIVNDGNNTPILINTTVAPLFLVSDGNLISITDYSVKPGKVVAVYKDVFNNHYILILKGEYLNEFLFRDGIKNIKDGLKLLPIPTTTGIELSVGSITSYDSINKEYINYDFNSIELPMTFDTYHSSSLLPISTNQTIVPITQYDNNGVLTTVPANNDAVSHLFLKNPITGLNAMLYSPLFYTTINTAKRDWSYTKFNLPTILQGYIILGVILCRKDTNNFSASNVIFINTNKFSELR